MTNPVVRPTDLPTWKTLEAHAAQLKSKHLKDLFAADDKRFLPSCLTTPKT
jgi:glucose-6-phosphate isomerase